MSARHPARPGERSPSQIDSSTQKLSLRVFRPAICNATHARGPAPQGLGPRSSRESSNPHRTLSVRTADLKEERAFEDRSSGRSCVANFLYTINHYWERAPLSLIYRGDLGCISVRYMSLLRSRRDKAGHCARKVFLDICVSENTHGTTPAVQLCTWKTLVWSEALRAGGEKKLRP
jgi:hypothetical protein